MKIKSKIKYLILLMFFLITLLISGYKIITYSQNNKVTIEELENINNEVEVEVVPDSENVIIIPQEKEIPKSNYYWDYINMNLINVDFSKELAEKQVRIIYTVKVPDDLDIPNLLDGIKYIGNLDKIKLKD